MIHCLRSNPLQLQAVKVIPLAMVILASQFELAVGNPLHKVDQVPGNQSSGILDNLGSDTDMTLRDSFNGLVIRLADVPVTPFIPNRTL